MSKVWRWPIVVALLSSIGLVTALVGDGAGDVFSWVRSRRAVAPD